MRRAYPGRIYTAETCQRRLGTPTMATPQRFGTAGSLRNCVIMKEQVRRERRSGSSAQGKVRLPDCRRHPHSADRAWILEGQPAL